jgi:UDP-2,4-diacetamido-2,4,6-trideoxy-beta-L-altropyranose hydrolase
MMVHTGERAATPRIVLIAAHGKGLGWGHLARCFAIGQRWLQRGGAVELLGDGLPAFWVSRIIDAGIVVRSAAELAPLLEPADWCVLDGYGFTEDDLARAHLLAERVMLIADHGRPSLTGADLVLDQNLRDPDHPARYDAPEVLFGPRYAVLRGELRSRLHHLAARVRTDSSDPTLLVSLGGDPDEQVTRLVDRVLSDPRLAALEIIRLAGKADIGPDLERAQFAFAACGTTTWELCAFGVPAVCVALVDNQVPVGSAVASAGAGIFLGEVGALDPEAAADALALLLDDLEVRRRMSAAARALVDGDGVARVVARMWSHLLRARPARLNDAELLWQWRMDPEVRANSFSSDPIPLTDHERWLASVLDHPDRWLYVIEPVDGRRGGPVGQVRFDRDPGDSSPIVNVSVAAEWRGAGWGGALICAGMRRFLAESEVGEVEAQVKFENVASARAADDKVGYHRYRRARDTGQNHR